MHQRFYLTDHYLKLFFYFIMGLIVATLIVLQLLPKNKPQTPPPLPTAVSNTASYAWSPDYQNIAFQAITQTDENSQIIVLNIARNTSSTVATIPDAHAWFGKIKLAWLNNTTLAYSHIVTDDSLPNWEIVNNPTINQTIWQNRDIISVSPDYQKVLSTGVPDSALNPSQALEYEVIMTTNNQVIPTHINALTTTCVWNNSDQLQCTESSSQKNKIYSLKFSNP